MAEFYSSALTLPALTASGGRGGGLMVLGALTSAGELTSGAAGFTGVCTLEALTASGVASLPQGFSGRVTLPALVVDGRMPATTDITLPALESLGEFLAGRVWAGVAQLPRHTAAGVADFQMIFSGGAQLPALTARGAHQPPGTRAGQVEMRALRASGTFFSGGAFAADIALPALTVTGAHAPLPVWAARVALPALVAKGFVTAQIAETYRTWVVNTMNGAVTEYTGVQWDSIARVGNDYVAAGPAGLVRLTGTDDDGGDINQRVRFGFMDMGAPELKRFENVLLSGRTDGALRVTAWEDEDTSYEYVVPFYGRETLHTMRRKLGKGLKSRYLRVQVESIDGSRWDLDTMTIDAAKTSRRVG